MTTTTMQTPQAIHSVRGSASRGRRFACCTCCAGAAKDDHVGFGGWIEKDGHEVPCDSCEFAAKVAPLIDAARVDAVAEQLRVVSARLNALAEQHERIEEPLTPQVLRTLAADLLARSTGG